MTWWFSHVFPTSSAPDPVINGVKYPYKWPKINGFARGYSTLQGKVSLHLELDPKRSPSTQTIHVRYIYLHVQ